MVCVFVYETLLSLKRPFTYHAALPCFSGSVLLCQQWWARDYIKTLSNQRLKSSCHPVSFHIRSCGRPHAHGYLGTDLKLTATWAQTSSSQLPGYRPQAHNCLGADLKLMTAWVQTSGSQLPGCRPQTHYCNLWPVRANPIYSGFFSSLSNGHGLPPLLTGYFHHTVSHCHLSEIFLSRAWHVDQINEPKLSNPGI